MLSSHSIWALSVGPMASRIYVIIMPGRQAGRQSSRPGKRILSSRHKLSPPFAASKKAKERNRKSKRTTKKEEGKPQNVAIH